MNVFSEVVNHLALAVGLVCPEKARVDITICEGTLAQAVPHPISPVAFVCLSVCLLLHTHAVLLVVLNRSLVSAAVVLGDVNVGRTMSCFGLGVLQNLSYVALHHLGFASHYNHQHSMVRRHSLNRSGGNTYRQALCFPRCQPLRFLVRL